MANPSDDKDTISYQGRVLGPNGRSVAGARIFLTSKSRYPPQLASDSENATSGPDGRFEFTASKTEFADEYTVVTATAPNYGVGWVDLKAEDSKNDLTISLVHDDVPITGQIVDLEGKSIKGITLRVIEIRAALEKTLAPGLKRLRARKG